MKVGSKVVCVSNGIEHLRKVWGFNYPKKNDKLTVSRIAPHTNNHCKKAGIVFLWFVECGDLPIGLCDKTINGDPNFVEILLDHASADIHCSQDIIKKHIVGV